MKINIYSKKEKNVIKENESYELLKAEFTHILELEKKANSRNCRSSIGK